MPLRPTPGSTLTELILSTFRANGRLLEAGDRIASGHGLTSARWQVLGAIALADRPLTVPQIARRMGLTRQSVHATVGRLQRDGLVEAAPNADHIRSQLIRLTDVGKQTYAAIDRDQTLWVDELARGITRSDLETALRVLDEVVRRLDPGRTEARASRARPSSEEEAR